MRRLWMAFLIGWIVLTACGTLEVGREQAPAPDPRAATIEALATQNARLAAQVATLAAPTFPSDLGWLAYVHGGDIWVKALPSGEPRRLTTDGRNQEPRWSPSGQWLAFRKGEQVWVVRADGSDPAPVAAGALISAFAWAPDRDLLAYVSGGELYIANTDGSSLTKRVSASPELPRRLGRIAWNPDGQRIAYEWEGLSPDGRPIRKGIGIVTPEGKEQSVTLPIGDPLLVGWTGDGTFLLVQDGMNSPSLLADGSPLYALFPEREPIQLAPSILPYPDFVAPDPAGSGRVAVVAGGGREAWTNKRLIIVAPSSSDPVVLSPPNMAVSSPSWSPDGAFIAYVAAPDAGTSLAGGEETRRTLMGRRIFVVNTEGPPQPRPITGDPAYRDERPLWSHDGSALLFIRMDDQGRISLWLVSSAGGIPQKVADELTPAPDWFGYYGHIHWDDLLDWWRGPSQKVEALHPYLSGFPSDVPPGLVLGTESGLWKVGKGNSPERILDRLDVVLSPDGKQAVYVADADLWLIDLITKEERNLTNTPDLLECCPQWWPAKPGTLVYSSQPGDAGWGPNIGLLTVMEIGRPRYLVVGREWSGSSPGPAPDGDTIAFDQALQGYLFRWSDGRLIPFDPASYTFVEGPTPLTIEKVGSPSWSPDGRYLAWMMGGDFGEGWRLGLGVFDLRTQRARLLRSYEPLDVGEWPGAAVWSPDGQWLACVVGRAANPDEEGLYVLRSDGSQEHYLGSGRDPVWSPDGRWLAFRRGTDLWLADREGWALRQVAREAWPVAWLASP
ncbi:MAG: hypothetical protein N3B68_07010 [Anaerolineae bacterium]|nr:hypothetical protein [Anaerolineae bacterium]